ncbi:hypothetical protein QN277_019637 [Acacia crassicarpa]|uniref:RNase H type-1 domain-containing protein n=1 Tax=Acacia crassicarpa TaxID=499986 RepID=A0AAE1JMQ6_9FABA|nr:hypothetical protein QN277_019637 [Acacia crassicarpa]
MRAGAGCIIRDHEGRWLDGCCRNIRICNSLAAELWALLDGLRLAWSRGYKDLEVQVDCLVALKLVQHNNDLANASSSIVRRIHNLLDEDWRVTITHVYREGNQCADFLATFALNLEEGLHLLQEPPRAMHFLLHADAVGEGRVRMCPVSSD